jgi:hypothetical protein
MVSVLGLFEVTLSICAVVQGLARLARLARPGVWLDAWTCLDVVRAWYGQFGRLEDVWQTSGRRLADVWNTCGIRVEYVWNTSGTSGQHLAPWLY